MKLDVGCGMFPKGDVNVDLFMNDDGSLFYFKKDWRRQVHKLKIPNFILASAYALPFKDKAFEEAQSSHLIEHLQYPFNFLKEITRVSPRVTIYCPHKLGDRLFGNQNHYHFGFFSKSWFYEASRKLNFFCIITFTQRMLLIIPREIKVELLEL